MTHAEAFLSSRRGATPSRPSSIANITFTFTFICHPGKTHIHRSRGDTPWTIAIINAPWFLEESFWKPMPHQSVRQLFHGPGPALTPPQCPIPHPQASKPCKKIGSITCAVNALRAAPIRLQTPTAIMLLHPARPSSSTLPTGHRYTMLRTQYWHYDSTSRYLLLLDPLFVRARHLVGLHHLSFEGGRQRLAVCVALHSERSHVRAHMRRRRCLGLEAALAR